jgi:2OG-Fe(II) oxygenase superfamily
VDAPTVPASRAASQEVGRSDLADRLAHRRWVRRRLPFPHVVAENVFVPSFYGDLAAEFGRIQRDRPEAFRRDMPGYDAGAARLDGLRDGPLGVFVSRPWHDLIAGVAGVRATGDVTASLHHHAPGSAGGWPHNDLNPAWFAQPAAGPDEVRLPGDGPVDYHRGTRPIGVEARQTVRAVSVLFYLANPGWAPGDGGETGLYRTVADRRPAAVVPPLDNSLVLFECTPHSWHGFLGNRSRPRNALVMWLHRDRNDVVARWGAQSIVPW